MQNPTCETCGGKLKPWNSGWMHVDHSDWKLKPHDPVILEVK